MEKGMDSTVEQMLDELKKLEAEEAKISNKRIELIQKICNAPKESWDWISVQQAASILDRSEGFVYARINAGKLKTLYQGSRVNVSKKEIMSINDKYRRQAQ